MKAQTKETQQALSPQAALEILKEGNARFVNKKQVNRDLLQQVNETSGGQYPFTAILSCIDSRVPVEIVFDQGIGDVFSARVAGNIANEDLLGSIEYACKAAGSKLIVVLGHTGCGAVKGACDDVQFGNLTGLLDKIKPAVDGVQGFEDRSSANADFVQQVVEKNVALTLTNVREKSPVLKEMLDAGNIALVGAVYDVSSGKVDFWEA